MNPGTQCILYHVFIKYLKYEKTRFEEVINIHIELKHVIKTFLVDMHIYESCDLIQQSKLHTESS